MAWNDYLNTFLYGVYPYICLTVLFVGSTVFTEQISASHHPDFEDYRRSTPMLIGWPRRAARPEA